MFSRATLSVNGILISYISGKLEKPLGTMLFLHGWRSEARVWRTAMEKMQEAGFDTCAIDLPGFGSSGMPPHAFSVAEYADVVSGFAEKLGIEKVLVVGHSFGGRIGIVLSVHHPLLVQKLILVDAAGIRGKSVARSLMRSVSRIVQPVFSPSFMQPLRRVFYKALGAEDYLATPELRETFKLVIEEDLTALLPHIAQETLLVWGSEDADTPLSYARTMLEKIPASRLETLRGAGHFSFLDTPEEFATLIKAFARSSVSVNLKI